jgi:hypothetical protein
MSRPYADGSALYLPTKLGGPLPLPVRGKGPPPDGWTGWAGPFPSGADVEEWAHASPRANIGLRLADGVLGLDVDAYGGKDGHRTLTRLEQTLGKLPPTVRSTSRGDGVSGIRLYRVPATRAWAGIVSATHADGEVTKGIEVIHLGHRYAVCWPSVHNDTRSTYRWLDNDGQPVDRLPTLGDLPELPRAWVDYLVRGKAEDAAHTADLTDEQTRSWLDDLDDREACDYVRQLQQQVADAMASNSRHDSVRDGVLRLLRAGEQGHRGTQRALALGRAAFSAAVTADGSRTSVQAAGEWDRMLEGGVARIVATPSAADVIGCTCMDAWDGKVDQATGEIEQPPTTCSLDAAHAVYRRWLGETYDLTALDAVLAAAAVDQLDGDTVWLLVVSGSGNAKTETVGSLAGAGAHVTSTVTSEGALLSATSRKDQSKDATGGLLRKIGDTGVLVIKDVTSILSMNRDTRAAVLAALREVYDGRWERNVGTDGGKSLLWTGRITVVGAVTTAYDSAHAVIASMGDRFALVRVDSNLGRLSAGRQALRNVGYEVQMRAELAEAAGAVLAGVDPTRAELTEDDMTLLLGAADLVTLARTAVERDYRGDVVEAHQPEAPTRFAKMLGQLVRGTLAVGGSHDQARTVAMRVAGDSVPPLRLLILGDLLDNPNSTTTEVQKRLQRPRTTVDRSLQEFQLLGLVVMDDTGTHGWRWSLSPEVDRAVLRSLVTRNVTTPGVGVKEEQAHLPTDIPGDACGCESAVGPGSHRPGCPAALQRAAS